MKTINVVAGIMKKEDKILIAKRGYGEFAGLYEFPGGKIEPNESPEDALKRELKEEMEAKIVIDSFFYHVHYQYSDFILEMDCFICHLKSNHIKLLEHLDYKWINTDDESIDWVPADLDVINELRKRGF